MNADQEATANLISSLQMAYCQLVDQLVQQGAMKPGPLIRAVVDLAREVEPQSSQSAENLRWIGYMLSQTGQVRGWKMD